ncbi:MgtC/SapB family protein [Bacillaceae bacterium]
MLEIDGITIVERLLLAALLGGVIGWEREQRNKQAGFKTHLLVSVGSALIMLISIYGFGETLDHVNARFDPARLAAQVVSGIGFIGAGAILRHSNMVVSGLTTAATLWVVAAIGLSVGSGFYFAAVATTAIVIISMFALRFLERKFVVPRRYKDLRIVVTDVPGKLGEIASILGREKIDIRNIAIAEENVDEEEPSIEVRFRVRVSPRRDFLQIIEELRKIEGVKELQYDE